MRRFDVVIVGAGVIGLAVALQVRRALGASTLVIDREDSPGMGSTSRANGGVRAQFTTPVNIAFSRYTIEALRELDATSSGLVGYRPVGYLFLAGTEASEAWLRSAYLTQRGHSVDVRWLTPGDVAALTPFIETRGLRAATFCASDGIIDPHGVVSALAGQCRRLGVEFELSCEVSAVDASGAPVRLQTARGGLGATWVVNAAGPNARVVAALAGIDLPVLAYRRNLVCTERVTEPPPLVPMCVDVDTGVLTRREGDGFLIGYSDPADAPSSETSFDPAFLEVVAARVGNRFPFLAGAPINPRKCWAGSYPETADHHAIIDAPEQQRHFIQCAGFGGHGIMHSLGAGLAVAELIGAGRSTSFDLAPLRLNRFRSGAAPSAETAVL